MVPVIRADLSPLITSILGDNRESEACVYTIMAFDP